MRRRWVGAAILLAVCPAVWAADAHEPADAIMTKPAAITRDTATFAAGCFWGVEAAFQQVKGVTHTTVGYTGGHTANPTYEQVCSHTTGHAEAVEVEYDPRQITYAQLLDVFWQIHDPTTKNRQGPDVGDQYRSAVFYHTPAQQETAEAVKARVARSGRFKQPIVTEITPATTFYRAEEYHQRYVEKHGGAAQCHIPFFDQPHKPKP